MDNYNRRLVCACPNYPANAGVGEMAHECAVTNAEAPFQSIVLCDSYKINKRHECIQKGDNRRASGDPAKKLEELRNGKRGTDAENQNSESAAEPVHVHDAGDLQDAVDDGVVLVDFYADWCGPCKQLEPVVERIAAGTAATVARVDIDAN